jgi:hypothetical protein
MVDLPAFGCRPKPSSISKKAENWHLDIGQIPPASGFHTLHVVLARRRLSVMVLRNAHPDATRFSAALSMIEIFRSG